MKDVRERDDRNIRLFGAQGQFRLQLLTVVIVGVGGLGSVLAQQLAFLGVGHIILVEDEELSETNRNRYVGARATDKVPGIVKVAIAERLIKDIDPQIKVTKITDQLLSNEAFAAIRGADWVFCCLDDDGPRAILNELCVAYDRPYVDLASDVPEPGVYGGRVTFVLAEYGCLTCRGVLNPKDVAAYFETDDQKDSKRKIYGIDADDLDGRGPAVAPINGVVASLAAAEFMAAATGMRPPTPYLEYRGHASRVVVSTDQPLPDCPTCVTRNHVTAANVERYLDLTYLQKRRRDQVEKG